MIEEYFQLNQQPFKISTDPQFYFDSERHRKALSYLQYGLEQAEGFVVVTGDAGVGKTTLVEQFVLETAESDIITGTITVGHMAPGEIIDYVLFAFQLETGQPSYPGKHQALKEFLQERHEAGCHALLIVDEAQNLTAETLEELRALSGITVDGSPLLQIFLLGQSAFKQMLARKQMEQFRQRVIAACHLSALDAEETAAYIDYRLAVAGWDDEQSLFTDRAHEAVFNYTVGVPRNINKLCARLLLQVALDERDCVNVDTVACVIAELEGEALGRIDTKTSQQDSAQGNEKAQRKGTLDPRSKEDNVVSLATTTSPDQPADEPLASKVKPHEPASPSVTVVKSKPLSTGLTSILDRLRPQKQGTRTNLSKASLDSVSAREGQREESSLEEVADEIAAHQAGLIEESQDNAPPIAMKEMAREDDIFSYDDEDNGENEVQENRLPLVTEIDDGSTPQWVELKSDLAGFIAELREGLMTVENNMSVVQDRAMEMETNRTERNQMISRRLLEIDMLLKEMRGEQ